VLWAGRRDVKDMKLLNLVYDLTPSDLIVVSSGSFCAARGCWEWQWVELGEWGRRRRGEGRRSLSLRKKREVTDISSIARSKKSPSPRRRRRRRRSLIEDLERYARLALTEAKTSISRSKRASHRG
jgi:hypothetical protein